MASLIIVLLFCQALGACIGAGTAVWAELAYFRAMRDGKIDTAERAHLNVIAHGLRFGMTILLLSSFALIIAAYAAGTLWQPALSANYWTLLVFAILVIAATWALSRRFVSFTLGSAAVFTAWWLLLYVTFGALPLSFGAAIAFYVVAVVIFYAILRALRSLATRSLRRT